MLLGRGADFSWGLGLIAAGWIVGYFVWRRYSNNNRGGTNRTLGQAQKIQRLHPGEASGCACTCRNFWQQAMCSALRMLRFSWSSPSTTRCNPSSPAPLQEWPMAAHKQENLKVGNRQSEIRFAAAFALWPLIGLAGAILGGWYQLPWLAPLGVGGLFCHYWLDGRIWTRRSMAG